jgi:hypothetical protein
MNDPIENDETELDLEEEPEVNHEVEKLETLMVSTETALKTLINLADRVKRNGTVDRVSANTIQTLTTGMESMESHFTKYPVASYTGIASTTNLAVTLEGLLGSIVTKTIAAIKAIFKFVVESFKKLWQFTKGKDKEYGDMVKKAQPMLTCDYAPLDDNEIIDHIATRLNDNPSVIFLGTGKGKMSDSGPSNYAKNVHSLEHVVYKEVTIWVEELIHKLSSGKLSAKEIISVDVQDITSSNIVKITESLIGCFTVGPYSDSIEAVIDGINAEGNEKGSYTISTAAEINAWRIGFAKTFGNNQLKPDSMDGYIGGETFALLEKCEAEIVTLLKSPDCTPELNSAYQACTVNVRRCFHALKAVTQFRLRFYKNVSIGLGIMNTLPKGKKTHGDFEPSNNLKRFVEEGDLNTIRVALRFELNELSNDNHALIKAMKYTKERTPGLFEEYKVVAYAREIGKNRDSQEDTEYYGLQVTYLKTNFCEKRFLHLIEVRQVLRDNKVDGFAPR